MKTQRQWQNAVAVNCFCNWKLLLLYVIGFWSLMFISCATTGPGGKKDIILISTQEEVQLGKEISLEVESQEKILQDPVVTNYVNQVGQAIAKITDRSNLNYSFKVLESEQVNAFALPGGFLYIYTGLLKLMKNEAQLEGVLAHEVSHVVGRHGVKRLQQVYGIQILLDIALGKKNDTTRKVLEGASAVILQGHGRGMEFEADDFGTIYTNKAGNNPVGMVQLLEILKSLEGNPPSTIEKILSSHPPTSERIAKVNTRIGTFDPSVKTRPYGEEAYKNIKDRLK